MKVIRMLLALLFLFCTVAITFGFLYIAFLAGMKGV